MEFSNFGTVIIFGLILHELMAMEQVVCIRADC